MKRILKLSIKVILNILLHICWSIAYCYSCVYFTYTDSEASKYISDNNYIITIILCVITNIIAYIIYKISPFNIKSNKFTYWIISVLLSIFTIFVWTIVSNEFEIK